MNKIYIGLFMDPWDVFINAVKVHSSGCIKSISEGLDYAYFIHTTDLSVVWLLLIKLV